MKQRESESAGVPWIDRLRRGRARQQGKRESEIHVRGTTRQRSEMERKDLHMERGR